MPRSCNDTNVLQRSPLMTWIAMGEGPPVEFEANGQKYNYGYFLADDIYQKWCTFVKLVVKTKGKKQVDFHNVQATALKMWREHLGCCKPNFLL
jgi:hypothetical protein